MKVSGEAKNQLPSTMAAIGAQGSYVRRAAKAGSWYESRKSLLDEQLTSWLAAAEAVSQPRMTKGIAPRAIIAPHAGYSYSGPTAGYAYTYLREALQGGMDENDRKKNIKRIFVLGPSHHARMNGCSVSGASVCATPVGDLVVDDLTRDELLSTAMFGLLMPDVDEAEHSIEMHLPYIAKVIQQATGRLEVPIVPIMVGQLSSQLQVDYGAVFAPYLANPENFFVISSDFCHWGRRFNYQPIPEHLVSLGSKRKKELQHVDGSEKQEIFEFISALDHEAMAIIERGAKQSGTRCAFEQYLTHTRNTICGRMPIAVLLAAMEAMAGAASTSPSMAPQPLLDIKFVAYKQSSKATKMSDSSVSYASAVLTSLCDGSE